MLTEAPHPARIEYFQHGDFAVKVMLPESSEALIDEDEFDTDERLPYWAELWPAARALARVLLDEPSCARTAIELGCGVGLPSLVLCHRGVKVVATDYYEDALTFTAGNAEHNGIAPPATLLLDWRFPPENIERFDLIVAADVLYEARNLEALASLIPRLVTPRGSAFLADPGRVHLEPFIDRMTMLGWSVDELDPLLEPSPAGNGMDVRVRLLRLSPPNPDDSNPAPERAGGTSALPSTADLSAAHPASYISPAPPCHA
jgi:predicted nicotinamide N-methyase